MSATAGPDFICVGMPKAGTGWLFDQLQFHPDFWMPPVKELHYLDREFPKVESARKILDRARHAPKRLTKRLSRTRPWDERDLQFLEQIVSYGGERMDIERYAALFRYKGTLKAGDITPGYGALRDDVVALVAKHLPNVRVILLVRDPVARAWSHICHLHRRDNFNARLLTDPVRFGAFLSKSNSLSKLSFATHVASRWSKFAPDVSFRYFFFDDLASRPAEARWDILTYLGADPLKPSGAIAPDHNRKSSASKLPLNDDIKAVLVEHFRGELLAGSALFGGHAANWPTSYGV
jgi:hypothetical protein